MSPVSSSSLKLAGTTKWSPFSTGSPTAVPAPAMTLAHRKVGIEGRVTACGAASPASPPVAHAHAVDDVSVAAHELGHAVFLGRGDRAGLGRCHREVDGVEALCDVQGPSGMS